MRRIAIINQKGGVGKTTTTVNLGSALARMGHRVLLIDLDPQAHLTLYLGQDPTSGQPGVYEMLTDSATVAKVRRKIGSNLWVCSASIDLAGAEVELVSVVGREVILRDLIDQHLNSNRTSPYDYVLMDCPPSLNVLTLNALCASNEVIIPLQPHYLALQGLSKLLETVAVVSKRINPTLKVTGVVVCMNEAGTKLAGEVVEDVRSFFDEARGKNVPWDSTRVFRTVIRRNIKLAESPSYGKSIFDYAPDSNGAEDYQQLAIELHSPDGSGSGLAAVDTTERASSAVEPSPMDSAGVPGPVEPPASNKPKPPAAVAGSARPSQEPPATHKKTRKPSNTKPLRQQKAEQAGIDPALTEPASSKMLTARPRSRRPATAPAKPSSVRVEAAAPTKRQSASPPGPSPEASESLSKTAQPVPAVDSAVSPPVLDAASAPATTGTTAEATPATTIKPSRPTRKKPRPDRLPAEPVVEAGPSPDPMAVVPVIPQTA